MRDYLEWHWPPSGGVERPRRVVRFARLIHVLALFGAGSLACAYASSPGAFIAARVLLGLGAAGQGRRDIPQEFSRSMAWPGSLQPSNIMENC